jgi:hypothetical protein
LKIFFGTLVSDYLTVKRVLSNSSVEGAEVIACNNSKSATMGWNALLEKAEKEGYDVAVLCHQDVYLPEGWLPMFRDGVGKLPDSWLIVGFYGIDKDDKHCGKIWDRRMQRMLCAPGELPQEAKNVDGCAFAVKLNQGFRFEPLKGYDVYDVYAGAKAREMGKTVWIIDAPPEHFATRSFTWKPDAVFMENWNWLRQRFPNEKLVSTCFHD